MRNENDSSIADSESEVYRTSEWSDGCTTKGPRYFYGRVSSIGGSLERARYIHRVNFLVSQIGVPQFLHCLPRQCDLPNWLRICAYARAAEPTCARYTGENVIPASRLRCAGGVRTCENSQKPADRRTECSCGFVPDESRAGRSLRVHTCRCRREQRPNIRRRITLPWRFLHDEGPARLLAILRARRVGRPRVFGVLGGLRVTP